MKVVTSSCYTATTIKGKYGTTSRASKKQARATRKQARATRRQARATRKQARASTGIQRARRKESLG